MNRTVPATGCATQPSSKPHRHGYFWDTFAKWLPVSAFAAYAALPTQNYYWDGVSFALDIEQAGEFGSASYWLSIIRPNHLLYDSIGYFAWAMLQSVGFHIRALTVLQAINMVLAAACVAILQRTLLRITQSRYLSATLALLFAFSASFWKFATDANAYIPSVLFLLAAFYVLCISSKPRPWLVGILHACAMLIHQLAIFFFPAAAFGIYLKGGRKGMMQYCAFTAAVTLPAYYCGFWLQERSTRLRVFVHWITFHSADSAFSFSVFKNLEITVLNYPRLFFGGTARLLQYFGPFMLIILVLLGAVSGTLLVLTIRYRTGMRLLRFRFEPTFPFLVSSVWLATYAVFLFFWLPSNTFYKLFCLPAIIVILASALSGYQGPRRYRLALFVATMALANLAFYIYPYSRPDYNQAMRFAHRMNQVWSDRTVVYYSDFVVDDWYIRYFNPRTTWRKISPVNQVSSFIELAGRDLDAENDVWIDSTAASSLMQLAPGISAHFCNPVEDTFQKHPIRYYRWKR